MSTAKERRERVQRSPVEQSLRLKAPEVRAILDGATELRSVVKPQPSEQDATSYLDSYSNAFHTESNPHAMSRHWCWWSHDDFQIGPDWLLCPYGKPGDTLWIRETWAALEHGSYKEDTAKPSRMRRDLYIAYRATDKLSDTSKEIRGYGYRPSTHMPEWAARIRIVVTGVRMERAESGLWEWAATFERTL